jgi:hypothetical protein
MIINKYAVPLAYPLAEDNLLDVSPGSSNYFWFANNAHAVLGTPWRPGGLPYSITMQTEHDTLVATAGIVSAGPASGLSMSTASGLPFAAYTDTAGTGRTSTVNPAPTQKKWNWDGDFKSTGFSGTVGGLAFATKTEVPASFNSPVIEYIGGDVDNSTFWIGSVKNVTLFDGSPIQGREYQTGDGTTGGTLNSSIPLDCSRPFNISFDWVNGQDGTDNQCFLGHDTLYSVTRLLVRTNGTMRFYCGEDSIYLDWIGALSEIALGQAARYEINYDGTNPATLTIDGGTPRVSTTTGSFYTQSSSIKKIMQTAGNTLKVRGAFANLNINITHFLYGPISFTYPLTKQPDNTLLIENTDPTTGAAFNGVWTAPNWVDVPLRSQKFAINEGAGTQLQDSFHPGDIAYNAVLTTATPTGGGWNGKP